MPRPFLVRGVSPLGRVVEVILLEESERSAKEKALGLGLRSVMVRPAELPPEPPPEAQPPAGDHKPPP